jgi:hypothetical protein
MSPPRATCEEETFYPVPRFPCEVSLNISALIEHLAFAWICNSVTTSPQVGPSYAASPKPDLARVNKDANRRVLSRIKLINFSNNKIKKKSYQ